MSPPASATLATVLAGDPADRSRLLRATHDQPQRILGPHAAAVVEDGAGDEGVGGTVVRVYRPDAVGVEILRDGEPVPLASVGEGLWAVWLPGVADDLGYRVVLTFADGSRWERHDPYRFPATISDFDLYLISEGTHLRLWECLGARHRTLAGVDGYAFSVWAPNARRVSVVGEFCRWDGRQWPMRRLGGSGVFDLFLPHFGDGETYKFEILTGTDTPAAGAVLLKSDPLARYAEKPPMTASRAFRSSFEWHDGEWMAARRTRDVTREPMVAYEVHLGSWKRDPENDDQVLDYRESARLLVEHAKAMGFNYLELMPVAEHPFDGSWGYQIAGYYAPTSRYGDPDDFRWLVDHCHRNGVGVILDWVPGHFVKDAHGLGRFDGSALYEHADPRRGIQPDWDTYIFNFGRYEVRNFLIANALYWLEEFHVDGLRVDAVASMLYLDYSRKEGEWIPNVHGGRENLDAIDLFRRLHRAIREHHPGCFTIAEESTAWPRITRPPEEDGLGFNLKWNMGWMHDTLSYFSVDPFFRSGCHDQLTFAMVYEYSEHYVNPLSHDEVVHGKGSLYNKMPGDAWRKLANLRTLLTYQITRPGKVLLFMGSELASTREWNHETGLDWYLLGDPDRRGLFEFLCELGHLYRRHPCLWRSDPDPEGFQWIACHDKQRSVVAYERRLCAPPPRGPEADGTGKSSKPGLAEDGSYDHLVVVLNLTPVPRPDYRLGAPRTGRYRILLSGDDTRFGGSGYPAETVIDTVDEPCDGYHRSMVLTLPPLAALILEPLPAEKKSSEKKSSGKKSSGKRNVAKKPAKKVASTDRSRGGSTAVETDRKAANPGVPRRRLEVPHRS